MGLAWTLFISLKGVDAVSFINESIQYQMPMLVVVVGTMITTATIDDSSWQARSPCSSTRNEEFTAPLVNKAAAANAHPTY